MSVSDDVGNLFRRFGGDAGQYQEVARDDEAKHAALRWPLLNALDIAHAGPVPDAGRPSAPSASPAALTHRVEAAASSAAAFDEPPAQTAASASRESAAPVRLPLFARAHRHATMPPPVAPLQTGANRFAPPPAVAPSTDRSSAAANAPGMSAATAAAATAAAPSVAPTSAAPPVSRVLASQPQREARGIPAAPFLGKRQTFAPPPFGNPVSEGARAASSAPAQQEGGSILSGLFGGKLAAPSGSSAAVPSKDLSSLFARLSGAPAAPGRSLRDTFRTRFKVDGEA
ncbi:cellulose biosynthesis protein BcsP [Paraburkholderia azotifigens]|uniref:Cellulose biosynthesis protein BcsP n=1 Tax=Paraburkholderia azotifigens TaxID=2057004 RepID=A0A5C6VAS2_9BURK|nr:cellulose biosynthesis protein BcsP [Paraburkholderia azotifigens]TXC82309.1 hypothetical protein FRZ40_17600 [Paraburkholderia azotifigens]